MKKAKLSLLLPAFGGGGAERVMVQLSAEFAKRGHDVEFVVCRRAGAFEKQLPPSVGVVELGRPARYAAPALARYIRRRRPTALLSALENANIIATFVRLLPGLRVRTLLGVHNHMSTATANADRLRSRLVPSVARLLYPHADAIVAVSNGVADDISRVLGLPRERIHTIHNPAVPVDIDSLIASPVPHPWLEPGRPPVILGVGRLIPQKDFGTLVTAFAKLRAQRPCRLVILGEGHLRPQLERTVADAGLSGDDVLMPGYVDNPFAWMSRANVFALSSAWEGFGNVVAEALACGTPVVSTDCPSGPAEILENGQYGQLVPVGDVEAFAAALATTLDTPMDPERLRARGREFSPVAAADRYLELCLAD